MNYTLRPATTEDAEGIANVLTAAFEEFRHLYPEASYADTVITKEGTVERMKEMRIIVAVDGSGSIIGTAAWKKVGQTAKLRGMAVLPSHQGTDGPALSILLQVEDEARAAGCNCIQLDTTEPLQRAIAFYQKHGFRATGKVGDYFGIPLHEYSKSLR